MTKPIILVTIDVFINTEILYQSSLGDSFDIIMGASSLGEDDLARVHYIIAGLELYSITTLSKFPNLKGISRVGVGVDNIDLNECIRRGVVVVRTTDAPSVAVAELCVGNMISLLRNTFLMNSTLKSGVWNPLLGRELRGLKVGIVGLGSIGKPLVERLAPFEVIFYGHSRTWPNEFCRAFDIQKKTPCEIFSECDVVSVHLPLDDVTRGFVSRERIAKMKNTSILLNTSRAGVIDNSAVAEAISNGLIWGAAIDVFDDEFSAEPYRGLQNVILTPHIGSHTRQTRFNMEKAAVRNIELLIDPQCSIDSVSRVR